LATLETEPNIRDFTGEEQGDMFLFAYAQYLRDYDAMIAQTDKLHSVAARLGNDAIVAFASDPTLIDALPADTEATRVILGPLSQASLLTELAEVLENKFEDTARDFGFTNPNSGEEVFLPFRQPVTVASLPGKESYIRRGLGKPVDRVTGTLCYGTFRPYRLNPDVLSRPLTGTLNIDRDVWAGFGQARYRVNGLIDRNDYTPRVKLTLH
jgi:hypothetical protein